MDTRCIRIKKIQYDEVEYMNEAYSRILQSPVLYDGIILDMQFSRMQDTPKELNMGEELLKRLKHRNINISVLGNSTTEFPNQTEYPFLKGNTEGCFNLKVLNSFLESL